MLANDLRLGPPLQALRALVPDCDPPFRIEHVDRITLRAVDKQVQLLSGSGPSAQTRRDLLILLAGAPLPGGNRSEEHTSELQSLMRISYAVFCLKKKTQNHKHIN